MNPRPLSREDPASQIPALQLLQVMGWQYLTPEQALDLRGGRRSGVILDGILEKQLRVMNHIEFKGKAYPFSENNIIAGIEALKDFPYDGLVRTSEKVYDLLCLGKSLQQSIRGDTKSFTLRYIDWDHPENNVYHVTEEFAVERTGRRESYRPDIVLFVNGIPMAVIECKRPDLGPGQDPIRQAVSQHIRNQKDDGIPHLFLYAQLLMSVSVNQAKYGTAGTPLNYWAAWREQGLEEAVARAVKTPLPEEGKQLLMAAEGRADYLLHFEAIEAGGREVTAQDRALLALCRPERLLDLAHRYIVFDAGEKKIARYQQYFCVQRILKRVRKRKRSGARKGGVVWHTQGSGKSLTMVMLAKNLVFDEDIPSPKVVLVTDRVDLDDQIYSTFRHCGHEVHRARTGVHLVELLQNDKVRIVTTVIDKFEAAAGRNIEDEDENIFVLVDEGHRGQYRELHTKMRRSLPHACFIAFTGTPIMKRDRNTYAQFDGLIDTYTIQDAVDDKAVVPLMYEGRDVPQIVDKAQIDGWFEKQTRGLTREQKADLKRKFATADELSKAEAKVRMIAWDVSSHFDTYWKGTGFKGQLVTPDKATALLYRNFMEDFGLVTTEVLISAPDTREGETSVDEANRLEVVEFWKWTMKRFGTEKEYNRAVINAFKHGDEPEIIIVVDKLLVGFDAKRNTVLYLTRRLKEHALLQAIARVNRIHEGKDHGYILDYRGVLEDLDKALDFYADLSEFDHQDLAGAVTAIEQVCETLPQRHSHLWDVFKTVRNKRDREAFERLLFDEEARVTFYERFAAFARALNVALSSITFLEETPEKTLRMYKADLAFFADLRSSVRRRYAEVIDYSEYERRIRRLLHTHTGAEEAEQVVGAIDLLNKQRRAEELNRSRSTASKADLIASNVKRVIHDHMEEDPAFYRKFGDLLEEVIRASREERLAEAAYFEKVQTIERAVLDRTDADMPAELSGQDMARRYYGVVLETLKKSMDEEVSAGSTCAVEAALSIDRILRDLHVRDWTANRDQQNAMRTAMEDALFELTGKHGLAPDFEDLDAIMDRCLDIAARVMP